MVKTKCARLLRNFFNRGLIFLTLSHFTANGNSYYTSDVSIVLLKKEKDNPRNINCRTKSWYELQSVQKCVSKSLTCKPDLLSIRISIWRSDRRLSVWWICIVTRSSKWPLCEDRCGLVGVKHWFRWQRGCAEISPNWKFPDNFLSCSGLEERSKHRLTDQENYVFLKQNWS